MSEIHYPSSLLHPPPPLYQAVLADSNYPFVHTTRLVRNESIRVCLGICEPINGFRPGFCELIRRNIFFRHSYLRLKSSCGALSICFSVGQHQASFSRCHTWHSIFVPPLVLYSSISTYRKSLDSSLRPFWQLSISLSRSLEWKYVHRSVFSR